MIVKEQAFSAPPGAGTSFSACFTPSHPLTTPILLQCNPACQSTYRAITESIDSTPQYLWNSITFDNGGEAARHTELRNDYNIDTYIDTYFCDAYASWQKGGVENLNGLIRQYLPRKTNLGIMTQSDITVIQEKLNNRPRKALGYLTPNEFIKREIAGRGGALIP